MRPNAVAVAVFLIAGALLVCPSSVSARSFLQAEVWAELEPMISPTEGGEWSREGAAERMLELARFVFSGMTYGFSIRYVPAEPTRGVGEEFEFELRHEIVRGDPGLQNRQVRETDSRVYGVFIYDLRPEQEAMRSAFERASIAGASGAGQASYLNGPDAQFAAIADALKVAVREHARTLTRNRPAEIHADVLLLDPPILGRTAGNYTARVRAAVNIRSMRQYEIF